MSRPERIAAGCSLWPLGLLWVAPWLGPLSNGWYGLCALTSLGVALGLWRVAQQIRAPLNTAANLVTALREGNYALRGRVAPAGDAADQLILELNALANELRADRLDETETSELLEKVMSEIDTPVLAFDAAGQVVLGNLSADALLGRPPGSIVGETAATLGLPIDLSLRGLQRLDADLPGQLGPFELRVRPFRYRGKEHTLLVFTSLARLLRDEERRSQRRIISVLSHEINNSLAPIKSLAGRLQALAGQLEARHDAERPRGSDPVDDLRTGLSVIERRSEHLSRVMGDYAKLARTGAPTFRPISVREWIDRNARLWPSLVVSESSSGEVALAGDEALLDQVLVNLIKNALEATAMADPDLRPAAGAEPAVTLSWQATKRWLSVAIADRGQGLRGDGDPFLPFVTTKPEGSGIGLALCREVADAHGGRLELIARRDGPGCIARLTLPLEQPG